MKKEVLILITFVLGFLSNSVSGANSQTPTHQPNDLETEVSVPTDGWVKLSFEISETGTTENIKVIESSHSGYFDDEAIRLLSSWTYKPRIVDGNPVRQFDQMVQLDFAIEEDEN